MEMNRPKTMTAIENAPFGFARFLITEGKSGTKYILSDYNRLFVDIAGIDESKPDKKEISEAFANLGDLARIENLSPQQIISKDYTFFSFNAGKPFTINTFSSHC